MLQNVIILTIIFTDKSFSSFKSEFSNAFNISISLYFWHKMKLSNLLYAITVETAIPYVRLFRWNKRTP